MRRLTLTVTPEQAGRTVKSLLRRELHMADGAIARVKTVPDGICLNGAHARTVDRVAAGDVLTVRIDDKRSGGKFTPVAVPLDILYEDADLIALNKPAGMAVHGGYDRGEPTVANALAAYLGPDAVFHPVNRLDRGTSGVMLVARSGYVHDRLPSGMGIRSCVSRRAPAARTRSACTLPPSAIRCSAMRSTAAMRPGSRAPRCTPPRPTLHSPSPGRACILPRRSRVICARLILRGTYEETLHHDPV